MNQLYIIRAGGNHGDLTEALTLYDEIRRTCQGRASCTGTVTGENIVWKHEVNKEGIDCGSLGEDEIFTYVNINGECVGKQPLNIL